MHWLLLTPLFVSLDRASGESSAGMHLGVMMFEDHDTDGGMPDLDQPRVQWFGELAIDNYGLMASTSVIRTSTTTGFGTTHVGGYARFGPVYLRGGLIAPTTSFVPYGTFNEHIAVHGTLLPWLEERAYDADTWWWHLGASARFEHHGITLQLDAFTDVPIGDGASRVHLGGGVAYAIDRWRFGGELLVSGFMFDEPAHLVLERDVLIGATLSATYKLERGQELVAWFANPLDESLRSRWHAIGLGYQSAL